jgi:hypothetical protein
LSRVQLGIVRIRQRARHQEDTVLIAAGSNAVSCNKRTGSEQRAVKSVSSRARGGDARLFGLGLENGVGCSVRKM